MMVDPLQDDTRAFSNRGYFAICEFCYWSATILRNRGKVACPLCIDSSVSLIPLAIDEQCRINLEQVHT
jgi:hypothetical protein